MRTIERVVKKVIGAKEVYVGIDVHKESWHVTVRSAGEERFNGRIPGQYHSLKRVLERYRDARMTVAYEAGPSASGSWTDWSRMALKPSSFLPPSSLLSQAIR